ncbi:MAG: GNAT family N-acetyltransferase [bacterium]
MNEAAAVSHYRREKWNRLRRVVKDEGWPRLGIRVLVFLKELVYLTNEGYLYELQPLEMTYDPRIGSSLQVEVEELKAPADLSALAADLTPGNVECRLRNGEHGFVAMHGQEVIGTIWLTTRPTYFPGFEFRLVTRDKWIDLGSRTGFTYRGAVAKEFRGNRILSALYNAVVLKARALGMKALVTSAAKSNVSQRKAALRSGWKIRCLVKTDRILGILFRRTIPHVEDHAC